MIDFGDDTYAHSLKEHINLSGLRYLLVTHSHIDHFNPTIFRYRGGYYATELRENILQVYSTPAVKEIYDQLGRGKPTAEVKDKIKFIVPSEFEPLPADQYTIHALLASHSKSEKCFVYLVENEGKRVLFGNDSAIYPDETFEYLKKLHLDLVFLDCTYGLRSRGPDNSHMNLNDNQRVKERFFTNGTADDRTAFVCTHFSHACHATHEELCEEMEKHGFTAAYDGMIVNP